MLEAFAENSTVRLLTLLVLFAAVVVLSFALVSASLSRRTVRGRLEGADSPQVGDQLARAGSLRGDINESSWGRLVERIEKSGLSLTDTRDASLRQRLAA